MWGKTEVAFAKKTDNYQPLVDCNLRFQNQWEDKETGLYYNLNRYYDPDSGQYLSIDPIGLEGGLRTHGYVHDPMQWVDPLGLAPVCPLKNQAQGNAGRDALLERLKSSKRFEVIEKEVRINTPEYGNWRNSDIVVRDVKTNKIYNVEVKTGNATRDASQLARDAELARGNTTWGTKKVNSAKIPGISKGARTGPIETIEVSVDPSTGKIIN